ncbi:ATP-binding cassette domain-containing protein [Myceligenerans xiligouense]|uniref:UvrABC system protein A n=1 Tax=Myceligenerans xiligouense TaxID=253184 RepID=A0A3N4YIT1_9MICO|nr:ATP-binding cassette domain-containing protein [Myceligenerans xiligouense]RPF20017.1 excinuclease UvrABC ATPase subunit [Myceligenerans xiligouense]
MPGDQPVGTIRVERSRVNNLRDVTVDIRKQTITVITGVSGSGKSSLAFGTITAESQRLMNDTYPAHVQSALPRYAQPDVDGMHGLTASMVVDQNPLPADSRATVASATDVYGLLRLLFARTCSPPLDDPRALSYSDPRGRCENCEGQGEAVDIDESKLVDETRSLNGGALTFPAFSVGSANWNFFASSGFFDNDLPIEQYTESKRELLLRGERQRIQVQNGSRTGTFNYEGLIPKFRRLFVEKTRRSVPAETKAALDAIMTRTTCPECHGSRLSAQARSYTVAGRNIVDCMTGTVDELSGFLTDVETTPEGRRVGPLISALRGRLDNIALLGLTYMGLDRRTQTLSGGEAQRLKLVRHLSSSLSDLTYIFDEPTSGLHAHDVTRLLDLFRSLRDRGNTVLIVEHDRAIIEAADEVIDLGPGAGEAGGTVVFQGSVEDLRGAGTPTADHLAAPVIMAEPAEVETSTLTFTGAHNVADGQVELPVQGLTVVTGVAGSGKSTLVMECLAPQLQKPVIVDQTVPRGHRRSNVATYLGIAEDIRKHFAQATNSSPALFSANSRGACPECEGLGSIFLDLAHLDPVSYTCPACEGHRFAPHVLEKRVDGRNISDVLQASVTAAQDFFGRGRIRKRLATMAEVGLDYLTLGQPVVSLSGGERQRLKVATRTATGGRTYILDEPTTGLHGTDVPRMLDALRHLVDQGNNVIVIEHDLSVALQADWLIDVGPEAGAGGGRILFTGPPAMALDHDTYTARHLRLALKEQPS